MDRKPKSSHLIADCRNLLQEAKHHNLPVWLRPSHACHRKLLRNILLYNDMHAPGPRPLQLCENKSCMLADWTGVLCQGRGHSGVFKTWSACLDFWPDFWQGFLARDLGTEQIVLPFYWDEEIQFYWDGTDQYKSVLQFCGDAEQR